MSNTLIKEFNNNGFNAANQGDFLTAENEFKKAFHLNPFDQNLLFNFIKVLHVQKKYSEILDFISKASIQTRSNWNPSILFLVGQSAIKLNNDNLAREIYETLNSKNPKEAEFALPLSQVLLKLGELDKSITILNKAIKYGGSSIRDYRSTDGTLGNFQSNFKVYNKEGKKIGDDEVKKIVQYGRSTFYCPKLQNNK